MKKLINVENKEYVVTLREGLVEDALIIFVVFQLNTPGYPEFLYDEICFPITSRREVAEVTELFVKTTEVVEYNLLAGKMANAKEVFLEKVLEVPVSERNSRLHEIYYQNN